MPTQESPQPDNVMLGIVNPHSSPLLANQHKNLTGSDLCLTISGQDNPTNSASYGMGNNMMLNSDLGWLDLENITSGFSNNSNFGDLGNNSNPGSMPQDQFQMQFLDDSGAQLGNGFIKTGNPLNGCVGNQAHDLNSYLDPGLTHHSGFLLQSDENTLVELGLSTS